MGSREPMRSGRSNSHMSHLRRTSRQNPRHLHNPHLRTQRYPVPLRPKAKPHPFACNMCKRTFPLQNGLTRHLRYMHNVTCPVPERKQPRANESIPSEESAFPCDKCDMIARPKTDLKSHIRAKHPENPTKDAPRPQLIPQPASLRCEFCLRDFGNISGLACHKKFKHPPGTPILQATIQVTFPRNKKRQRNSSTPEREDREKVQCGACQKFYAHLASLVIHCRKFREGQGMPQKIEFHQCKIQNNKNERPSGISLSHVWSPMYE
ncbi:Tbingi protein [Trypanosoma theileri]|uniref:Tbingi protein n=1 Tax=Trypanosoma theileri TaxID=67003 RepID=A0A1X0NGC5_9TRYP|nr:Tbingi protein [Trypanosoma theileri]ORC83558.1 Tbingi protein [Trypanosoma theileri]